MAAVRPDDVDKPIVGAIFGLSGTVAASIAARQH